MELLIERVVDTPVVDTLEETIVHQEFSLTDVAGWIGLEAAREVRAFGRPGGPLCFYNSSAKLQRLTSVLFSLQKNSPKS